MASIDPNSMTAWLTRFLASMQTKGYSERSIEWRGIGVRGFIGWCEARSITRPEEVTRPIVERYQRYLFLYRSPKSGKPLSFRTQASRLVQLQMYFRWLSKQHVILFNPASDLELPKTPKHLPPPVLTASEVERVMMQPDTRELLGLRDRAILETFYSTGMRRKELAHLSVYDLDQERRTVFVRHGKGGKQRIVPIGERALSWVRKYLDEVRPQLVLEPDDGSLFVSHFGEAFTLARLSQIVRGYVVASGTGKIGASHALRHAMATGMLEGGADIRFIAAMLGHSDLATTQIYTQVGIRQLQRVHEMTHPASKLRPSKATHRNDIEGVRQAAVDHDELHGLVADDDDDDTDD